jgi:hypothetical protein
MTNEMTTIANHNIIGNPGIALIKKTDPYHTSRKSGWLFRDKNGNGIWLEDWYDSREEVANQLRSAALLHSDNHRLADEQDAKEFGCEEGDVVDVTTSEVEWTEGQEYYSYDIWQYSAYTLDELVEEFGEKNALTLAKEAYGIRVEEIEEEEEEA